MNDHRIKIPDGIDFRRPETITKGAIIEYYAAVRDKFGEFCGDCEYMTESGCLKNHRPRKYIMEIGPYDFAWLRKGCKDFEICQPPEIDQDAIARQTRNALDCNAQQYG